MLDEVGLPLQKQTRQPVPLMATGPSDDDKRCGRLLCSARGVAARGRLGCRPSSADLAAPLATTRDLIRDPRAFGATLVGTLDGAFERADMAFFGNERRRHDALITTLEELLGSTRLKTLREERRGRQLDELIDEAAEPTWSS